MAIAALRIDTDGTITELADREYDTLKAGVGGWIESVPTDRAPSE